jgi:hypothetical protein
MEAKVSYLDLVLFRFREYKPRAKERRHIPILEFPRLLSYFSSIPQSLSIK